MNEAQAAVFSLIEKYDSIVIFGHSLPDGDCYGSQIALREVLQTAYPHKKIYALGSGLSALFERLGEMDIVSDELIVKSLAILVDVSDFPLVEDQRVLLAPDYCKIDHHHESNPFPYDKIMDHGVIATAELIARIAFQRNILLSKRAAEAIFLGIVTDSGRFLYAPTRKETFDIISRLFDYGLEMKPIYDVIYQTQENQLKYKGFLLSHYQKTENKVVYCYAEPKDYQAYGLEFSYASSQVNVLANIQGSPIFALFTKNEKGGLRVELRSSGVPIRDIAVKYGGGGHANAAGVRMEKGGYQEAMAIVKDLDLLAKENNDYVGK
ncbi:MAG: bifunctional oligoribonuclease/PAP phosphatase NrnA [Epsilonproteobacteria bacterium]|nr:bifunctional oligoribonuclease/PAP phosphatase NrnA [Campylobacterota bacterium]